MQATRETTKDESTQRMLRQLFDTALTKCLAVECNLDAEQEMANFLHAVKTHPEQHAFVAKLFIEELLNRPRPLDLLKFCMHDLRWPDVRDAVKAKLDEDTRQHNGVPVSNAWNDILEAFRDDWEAAKYYEEFKNRR